MPNNTQANKTMPIYPNDAMTTAAKMLLVAFEFSRDLIVT